MYGCSFNNHEVIRLILTDYLKFKCSGSQAWLHSRPTDLNLNVGPQHEYPKNFPSLLKNAVKTKSPCSSVQTEIKLCPRIFNLLTGQQSNANLMSFIFLRKQFSPRAG